MKKNYDLYITGLNERQLFELAGFVGGFLKSCRHPNDPLPKVFFQIMQQCVQHMSTQERKDLYDDIDTMGKALDKDSVSKSLFEMGVTGMVTDAFNSLDKNE